MFISKFYKSKNKAIERKNKNNTIAGYNKYVVVDGPNNNYAIVDRETAKILKDI